MDGFDFKRRDPKQPLTGIASDPSTALGPGDLAQLHDGQVAVYAKITAVLPDRYKAKLHSFVDLSSQRRELTTFRGRCKGENIEFRKDFVISFIQSVHDRNK